MNTGIEIPIIICIYIYLHVWTNHWTGVSKPVPLHPLAVSHPLFIPDGKDAGTVLMGIYAPDHAPLCTALPPEEHEKFIDTLVMDTPVRLITHDLKTWLKPVYERNGVDTRLYNNIKRFSCSYLLAYLMDPPERIEGEIEGDVETSLLLENLVLKYLGEPYPRLETWLLDKDPADALYWRLWEDARYIGRLWDAMVAAAHQNA